MKQSELFKSRGEAARSRWIAIQKREMQKILLILNRSSDCASRSRHSRSKDDGRDS